LPGVHCVYLGVLLTPFLLVNLRLFSSRSYLPNPLRSRRLQTISSASEMADLFTRIRRAASDWRMLLVPFALLVLAVPSVVRQGHRAMQARSDTTYPESSLIQIGLWAAQSNHLYPALVEKPFTPAPHGPAYYLLLRR